jgi:hypothetical protein
LATPKHQCKWRKTAAQLEEKLAERDAQLAALCEPLWRGALAEVRVDPHVQADETSVRTQTRKER